MVLVLAGIGWCWYSRYIIRCRTTTAICTACFLPTIVVLYVRGSLLLGLGSIVCRGRQCKYGKLCSMILLYNVCKGKRHKSAQPTQAITPEVTTKDAAAQQTRANIYNPPCFHALRFRTSRLLRDEL